MPNENVHVKIDSTFDPELAAEILKRMEEKGLSKRDVLQELQVRGQGVHASMLDKWCGVHKVRLQAPSSQKWEALEEILGPGLPKTRAVQEAGNVLTQVAIKPKKRKICIGAKVRVRGGVLVGKVICQRANRVEVQYPDFIREFENSDLELAEAS
jgi:hypothetical protein